jgi:hypothetical protein
VRCCSKSDSNFERRWRRLEQGARRIEADSERYVEAQRKREADALAGFTGPFARNGGKRSDARAEWEKRRNKNAAEAAAAHDAATWRFTQSEPRRVV